MSCKLLIALTLNWQKWLNVSLRFTKLTFTHVKTNIVVVVSKSNTISDYILYAIDVSFPNAGNIFAHNFVFE